MSRAELEAALKECVSPNQRAAIENEIREREDDLRKRLTTEHPTLFADECEAE